MDSTTAQLTQWGQFVYNVIGTSDFAFFGALFFFALIGQAINLGIGASNRDVQSPSTPEPFSWKFFILDNWKRAGTTLLCIFVLLRFYPLFAELLPESAQPFFLKLSAGTPMLIGLIIGYGVDFFIGYLKDKLTILQIDRKKVMETLNK